MVYLKKKMEIRRFAQKSGLGGGKMHKTKLVLASQETTRMKI